MSLTGAAILTTALSYVVYATIAVWYVVPRLRTRSLASALTPLLWVHAFRHIALQLFSSQQFGFDIPDSARNAIAYGDLAGMILALASLYALRFRSRLALPLVWVFVAATVVDLVNAVVEGLRHDLFDAAFDVSWMILTFYVPALWVTLVMIVWLLVTRRGVGLESAEPLGGESPGNPPL